MAAVTSKKGPRLMQEFRGVYIEGEFVCTGRKLPCFDPSSGAAWAEVETGGADQVDAAVQSARSAQKQHWGPLAAWQRATVLRKFADILVANRDEIATVESRNNGKAVRDTREEVTRGAEWLRFFAGAASTAYGNTFQLEGGTQANVYREPLGVIGAITPWSSPVYIYMWKLAPALACGNAVVIKPSEIAPITCGLIAKYASEAGLPAGVLNVVTGDATAGAALAAHRGIDKLTFTGGVASGRAVAQLAAGNFTPTTIEAGGKTALIVLDDADLDLALGIAVRGSFRSAGQSCAHISRILVQRSIYAEFIKKFLPAVRELRVGPALDEQTDVGPVISEASAVRCEGLVKSGRSSGGNVLLGGQRAKVSEALGGYYFAPTVLDGVPANSRVMQEEIFGPIAAIMPFDDDDAAIETANNVDFGLVGALVTRSLSRYRRFVRDLDVGVICVNAFRPGHWQLPYGGRKRSGMGIDNGYDVLRDYTQSKTVMLGAI